MLGRREDPDLCRLAHLLADHFPLTSLILLDSVQQGLTLTHDLAAFAKRHHAYYLVFCEFGIMHILHAVSPRLPAYRAHCTPYTNASSHFLQSGLEKTALRQRNHSDETSRDCHALAISPQLLPASLITRSRCSSAGLQGVFVRFLLGTGAAAGSSVPPSDCS